MKKKTSFKLDRKDAKLVRELEKNSRTSITKIAKAIGVSKEVANYRLKRLIDADYIEGFRLIADYSILGYQLYRLFLNLYNIHETTKEDIINYIRKSHFASFNALLQSVWDIEVIICVKDAAEFHEFYDGFIEKYSDYIYDKDLSIITRTYFLGHPYLHNIFNPVAVGQQKPQEIDDTDQKIIEILKKNVRAGLLEIAKHTKVSPSTAQYRIKSLVSRGIIKGFRPRLNGPMLGYTKYKIEIILSNPASRKTIIQFLTMKQPVTKIIEFIGRSDFEFHADFRTPMDVENFLTELRTKFHSIKDYDIIPILKDEMH